MSDVKKGKRSKKLGINGLSTLEADIMNIIWQQKRITVRDVHETMLEDSYIPYTTVMAAMGNLAQKGLLKQNKSGKAYVYSASVTRESVARNIVDSVVDRILNGSATTVIAHLLDLKTDAELNRVLKLKDRLNG